MHAVHGPVAVMHLDAHSDTNPPVYGGTYHHGTPFGRAIEEGLIDPARMIQIGIRGHNPAPDSLDYARAHGVRVVTAADCYGRTDREIADQVRQVVESVRPTSPSTSTWWTRPTLPEPARPRPVG